MYDDSVKWMDAALEETTEKTLLGGQIQIQKALGLDAYGKRAGGASIHTLSLSHWYSCTRTESRPSI